MKKLLFAIVLLLMGMMSVAQMPPISHLEINNVRPTILGNGSYYYPNRWNASDGTPKTCLTWEVPEGSGKETIQQHSIWFGGLDSNGSLHLAAMQYGQNGQDYWMGPLRTADASVDLMTSLKFHRVWNLTRAEIEQFIAHHGENGYVVPDDILSWPAHGDAGYAENLAPFVDVNGDGHYNPVEGDYPDIKGDQCLYYIFNDSYGDHTETDGSKIGLEIHGMAYAFDAPNDEALNNTVFVNYKFFNRSSNNYNDVYVGLWNDWEIGCGGDDYVGCDVQRSSCFAYNGTEIDGSGEAWAYGGTPPVQVCAVLSGPDGLGMSSFVFHDSGAGSTGDPQNAQEYYNLLRGFWRDGTAIQYGGTGHSGDPNAVGPSCHYMYPGNSDPDNIGTEGVAPNGGYNANGVFWTEEHEGNAPGDRRGLVSVGPFDFPAGSMKELNYAMITVWKNDSQSAMERMGVFVDHVSAFFDGYVSKAIKFIKSGTNIGIRSSLSADKDIMVTMYRRNGNTTFNNLYVGNKSLSDSELTSDENLIRNIGDMVGPVGVATFWALYAQHGWAIPRMVMDTQTLDDNDIGSIWEDQNGRRFVIGKISDNDIYLIPELTMSENGIYSASWNAKLEYPSLLTHVSGAAHTASITGCSSRYDLLIQQVSERHYVLDGREIIDNGVYYGNHLRVQEHILGYNIGKVESWFPVPEYNGSLIDFDRFFEFNNGMNVTCNTTMYCRYPFEITSFRNIQPQFLLPKDQYQSYAFIPKVRGVYNDHRVDMPFVSDGTEPSINIRRNASQLYDVDKQPERCMAFLQDDVGNTLLGMSGGCSLTRGTSVDSLRNININIGNSCALFGGSDVPNKFYPGVLYSLETPVDTSFVAEVSGYYTWFDPSINDCFVHYYKDGDNYILYIHAFESMPRVRINLPNFMNGMVVESIIEQTAGSSLLTNRVVGGGLYASFNTDDNLANYIVVKLKSTWN